MEGGSPSTSVSERTYLIKLCITDDNGYNEDAMNKNTLVIDFDVKQDDNDEQPADDGDILHILDTALIYDSNTNSVVTKVSQVYSQLDNKGEVLTFFRNHLPQNLTTITETEEAAAPAQAPAPAPEPAPEPAPAAGNVTLTKNSVSRTFKMMAGDFVDSNEFTVDDGALVENQSYLIDGSVVYVSYINEGYWGLKYSMMSPDGSEYQWAPNTTITLLPA